MDTTQKKWFVHVAGKQQGPYAFEEVRAKVSQKQVTPETQVWCEGMAAWAPASTIAELKSIFAVRPDVPPPGATQDVGELSALLEVKPNDVDDRTGAIDSRSLKQAKKEAAQVHKISQKAEKEFVAQNPTAAIASQDRGGGAKWMIVGALLLVVGGGAVGLTLGLIPTRLFGPQVQATLEKYFSPIPKLDDVSPEQYLDLKNAAMAGLSAEGAKLAIGVSNQSLDKPVFYVAGNLPEGTNLIFFLRGNAGTLLTDKQVVIRFPVALTKHMAKTRSIHTVEGGALPPGEYTAIVVEDDEQLPNVKATLAALPARGGQLPSDVPSGRKVVGMAKMFLGGKRDPDYQSKLGRFQSAAKEKATVEFKKAKDVADHVSERVQETLDGAGRYRTKKSWDDFHRKWISKDGEPQEKGYFYSGIFQLSHDLWQLTGKLHEQQNALASATGDRSALQSQVNDLTSKTSQKLLDLKSRLEQATRSQSDPSFMPAAGSY